MPKVMEARQKNLEQGKIRLSREDLKEGKTQLLLLLPPDFIGVQCMPV